MSHSVSALRRQENGPLPLPFPQPFASGPPVGADPCGIRQPFFVFISWVLPRATISGMAAFGFCEVCRFMQIMVRDNNVDQALRALKKKLQREGVYREMKLRRHYEKPSEKRAREKAAAVRRARKLERKRMERDGSR